MHSGEKWELLAGKPGDKMIYFKSRSGRDDVMAILIVEEEEVIWHQSQRSPAAESEAGKAD